MEKVMKKFILVVLAFAIIIPVGSAYTLNKVIPNNDIIEDRGFKDSAEKYLIEEYGKNYMEIIERNTLSVENANKIISLFPVSKLGEAVYPNYIGGIYINDNEDLVIQIVESIMPNKKDKEYSLYNEVLAIDNDAKIEYVKYSYTKLMEVNKIIENYYTDNYVMGNIKSFYVDTINNKIVVNLKNYTKQEINNFKNTIIDSPLITFEDAEETEKYATYNPGSLITQLGCSVGYRAKKASGEIGFVTAGHCVTGVNQNISGLGIVRNRSITGNKDASFIATTGHTLTNTLQYKDSCVGCPMNTLPLQTSVKTSFVVGQKVGKVGISSQFRVGTITNTSYADLGMTGLVNTNVYSKEGDSGGAVFIITGVNAAPIYTTAGIVTGGPKGGGNMFFSRADVINSSFGISRY